MGWAIFDIDEHDNSYKSDVSHDDDDDDDEEEEDEEEDEEEETEDNQVISHSLTQFDKVAISMNCRAIPATSMLSSDWDEIPVSFSPLLMIVSNF